MLSSMCKDKRALKTVACLGTGTAQGGWLELA